MPGAVAAGGGTLQVPLVGRAPVLRRLIGVLDQAQAGGVAIVGHAGVGKSRLAEEVARVAAERGRRVDRIVATPAAATIPLGALAPLVAVPTGTGQQAQLIAGLLAWFRERATPSGPVVLTVDDARHLDDQTATVVHQAIAHRLVTVILTGRDTDALPAHVRRLWTDDAIEHVELEPLSEDATLELTTGMLDGPVHPLLLARVWRLSRGNPLVVRELLLAGQESGEVVKRHGLWRVTGAIAPSGRLGELVRSRLGRLQPDERSAVESLAVAGSLELLILEGLTSADVIERLEERRIVHVEQAGNRHLARLEHPIYGEVTIARLPRTRARRRMRDMADALAATGARRTDDVVRLALWRLDGGATPTSDVLLAAGNRALGLFDERLAERFARAAATDATASAAASLLLGRALAGQQRIDEALTVLAQAAEQAGTEDEVAAIALARATTLYFRAGRNADAAAILTEALEHVENRDWRDELSAMLTLFHAAAGELRAVAAAGRSVARRAGARPRAVVNTLVFASIANVMLGRFAEAEEQVRHGLPLAAQVGDELPLAGDMLRINGVMAAAYGGRSIEAVERGLEGHRAAVSAGAPDVAAMWSMNLAECQMLAGDVTGALGSMLGSLDLLRDRDPFSVRGIGASVASVCAAWLGRRDEALELQREVEDLGLARDVRSRIQHDRATVWTTWLQDGPSAGARVALAAAQRALAGTHLVWAGWLLYDAVRLGAAAGAAEQLRLLARRIEGDLLPAMALHASALEAGDPVGLERAASAFDRRGSRLFAAEAAAQAHAAYQRAGRVRLASVAGARAALLAARCPGVVTPPLAGAAPTALTPREHEIARLAAEGRSSREVGRRLGISVRTVDNHLGAIYDKLGITGRSQLSAVLGISNVAGDRGALEP